MPFQKGHPKFAGKKKGFIDNTQQHIQELCARLDVDTMEVQIRIAKGDIPCGTCFGKGKTYYSDETGKKHTRECQSCHGTLREKVNTDQRFKAAADINQYLYRKLKAIELTGAEGGPVEMGVKVIFVNQAQEEK